MFDKIAQDWKRKRNHPWEPFISLFSQGIIRWKDEIYQVSDGNHLIFCDLGCGSGRHSEYFSSFCSRLLELDQSREMLKRNRNGENLIQADLTALPFRSDQFDGIFSIAALHHVKGSENRAILIKEMERIGLKNALICITVWRFYQKKFIHEMKRQLKDSCNYQIDYEIGDISVPWALNNGKIKDSISRFYHLFRINEFRKLISPFQRLIRKTMGKADKKDNFFFLGANSKIL